jgi:hypothetical protein
MPIHPNLTNLLTRSFTPPVTVTFIQSQPEPTNILKEMWYVFVFGAFGIIIAILSFCIFWRRKNQDHSAPTPEVAKRRTLVIRRSTTLSNSDDPFEDDWNETQFNYRTRDEPSDDSSFQLNIQ